MKKNVIILTVLLIGLPIAAQESNLYEKGQEYYRNDENDLAIDAFETFILENPESNKIDDAQWYLGRLYKREGYIKKAEAFFKNIITLEKTNRRTEAFYDLAKIYDKSDREEEIILLNSYIKDKEKTDIYYLRALPILLKSYNLTGLRYRGEGLGRKPTALWREAIELIREYDSIELDSKKRIELQNYYAKFLIRLAQTSKTKDEEREYLQELEQMLSSSDLSPEEQAKFLKDRGNLLSAGFKLDYKVLAPAVYNASLNEFNLFLDSYVKGTHSFSSRVEADWKISYGHSPYTFKTFNFSNSKTGDAQFFTTTDDVSAEVSFRLGSPYFYNQTLTVDYRQRVSEDFGDNYWKAGAAWDFEWNLKDRGVIFLDNDFTYAIYPDYVTSSRELDHWKLSVNPGYKWVFNPVVNLTWDYSFALKQYLNAKYDTQAGGTDSENRQYLINSLGMDLEADIHSALKIDLKYQFEFLKSNNYDLWVSGTPSNEFITGFNDYFENSLGTDIELEVSRFSTELGADLAIRNYLNYIPRDQNQNFLNEKRYDLEWKLSLENRFEILNNKKWGKLLAALDVNSLNQSSNHQYEVSYLTNYNVIQGFIGFEWNK